MKTKKKYKKGGKFPDLNKDGKITRADILKGRGVFKSGGFFSKPVGKGVLEGASQMGGLVGMLSSRKAAKQQASEAGLTGKDYKKAVRNQTMAGFLPGVAGRMARKGLAAKNMANPSEGPQVLAKKGGRLPKYTEGGVAPSSLSQRVRVENAMKKKKKALEAAIKQAKGTPKAKSLVQEYRRLTGTK